MIIRLHKSHLLTLLFLGALPGSASLLAKPAPAQGGAKPKPAAKKPVPKKTEPAFDEWMSEGTNAPPPAEKKDIVKADPPTDVPTAPAGKDEEIVIPDFKFKPVVVTDAVTRNDKPSATTLLLAEDNTAKMPIVISPIASDATKAVAADLVKYLSTITGAGFQIQEGDGTSGIVLGTMKEFPHPELAEALKVKSNADGKEAFAIRTTDKRLLLLGATDLGASHAAYRLLREMGCRWFMPSKAWEVVPTTPKLEWNRDITDRPSMLSRVIWFEAGSGGAEPEENYKNWRRRNGAAESFQVNAGHALFVIPGMFPEEFKAHPEYYAQTADGKPNTGDIELTNPEVVKLIVEYVRRSFKQNPGLDMVSVDPPDSQSHSQSPAAKRIPYSDQVYAMANTCARMLQKEFPGKMVGVLSYNAQYDPPSFKLEPNVHVQMTGMSVAPKYTGEQRAKLWPQRSSNLGVYEYYSVFLWSGDSLPGSYTNDVHGTQKHIRDDLVNKGIVSMSAESTSSWGSNGRGYYFANALMWNPDQNVDAMLADFYDKAFGPGAPAMKKYYDLLDPANEPLMSGHVFGLAFRYVDEASKLAADRPDVQARLDQIKLYLRFIFIQNNKGKMSTSKDHIIDDDMMMENAYRTVPFALTAWGMLSQTWAGNDVYVRGKTFPKMEPYTHEEIEADFQEGLKVFEPQIRDVGPKTIYSTDLVPVRWTAEQKGIAKTPEKDSSQTYQGSMRYILNSRDGEPLVFTTEASDAWGYRTSFEVTDLAGKVLSKGKPEPKVAVNHRIEVPRPGLYILNYNDPGAYWSFTAKPSVGYSIDLLPALTNGRTARNTESLYFYVPKGTENIEFFPTSGGWLYGPDGSPQTRVEKANDYIKAPVPPGMDGKLWTLRGQDWGKLYFFNVPSYLSPTPDGVVVPREVAIRDGLSFRK